MTTIGSLCSGGGGLDLAVEAVYAARTVWHVENDPGASAVLAARWPGVPNHGDLITVDWARVEPVDILTAGFPCQDISYAGKRAGLAPGTRSGLWVYVAHAIDALRPRLVIIENVRGLLSARATVHSEVESCPHCVGDRPGKPALRALGAVLGELAALGYDACWQSIPAATVGAPHLRWRVFVLAWPADTPGPRLETGRQGRPGTGAFADPERGRRDRWPRATLGDEVGRTAPAGSGSKTGETPALNPSLTSLRGGELVALLPTPRATDGTKGGPGQRGSCGDLMLPSAVALLPTPTATPYGNNQSPSPGAAVRPSLEGVARRDLLPTPTVADSRGSRNATAGRSGGAKPPTNTGGRTLGNVAHADRWGQYAAAIARWEHILGRLAPEPTEPGTRGRPRLSPRFVEWMMGLPDRWVTDPAIWAHHPRPAGVRNAQLRILGNSVVPQQAAAAVCPPPPWRPWP